MTQAASQHQAAAPQTGNGGSGSDMDDLLRSLGM